MKDLFLLNPNITFLNHGSFGACPKPVFEAYQKWQLMLEQEPIQFITKTGIEYLNESRKALADFVHCNEEDLVYMTNPSTAMNTVIKSLKLEAGDEILTTNQEYGAMDRTWGYYCNKVGAKYIHQDITLPLTDKETFLKEFWSGLTPRTKIIFISQMTSPTSLIFPVKEICDKARKLGIMTIVDGAHVPAHIPLDIKDLDPDVYTGACHKWMLAPKGNSFLYVRKTLQPEIDPLVISWGYEAEFPSSSQFQDYHQFQGTRDFSAFLTTPAAIEFLKEHDWDTRSKACRQLLQHYYPIVAKELDSHVICPVTDEFLGQI
jgi:isopenicillin-N epimerase